MFLFLLTGVLLERRDFREDPLPLAASAALALVAEDLVAGVWALANPNLAAPFAFLNSKLAVVLIFSPDVFLEPLTSMTDGSDSPSVVPEDFSSGFFGMGLTWVFWVGLMMFGLVEFSWV